MITRQVGFWESPFFYNVRPYRLNSILCVILLDGAYKNLIVRLFNNGIAPSATKYGFRVKELHPEVSRLQRRHYIQSFPNTQTPCSLNTILSSH